MKEKHMKTAVWLQYFAALAVMTSNLTAHFLFLMSELDWIQLHIGKWAAAWLIFYPFLWILPLGWILLLSSLMEKHAPIGTKLIAVASVLPVLMLVFRQIRKLMAEPWYYPLQSWIFAAIQLIVLGFLWHKLLINFKKNT